MSTPRTWMPAVLASVVLLVVVACSSGSGGTSPAASAAGSTAGITVSNAWVRPPMGTGLPAAGYLTIVNGGTTADALTGASSPIATSVEIHETMAEDSGMTGMSPVSSLAIPAGATVVLAPGGYHLMLMGLSKVPVVGGTVQITLTFQHAGSIVVQAEVKAG